MDITSAIFGHLGKSRLRLPYSQKIWRELNLADCPESALAKNLAYLNLVERYSIIIRIYLSPRHIFQLYTVLCVQTSRNVILS